LCWCGFNTVTTTLATTAATTTAALLFTGFLGSIFCHNRRNQQSFSGCGCNFFAWLTFTRRTLIARTLFCRAFCALVPVITLIAIATRFAGFTRFTGFAALLQIFFDAWLTTATARLLSRCFFSAGRTFGTRSLTFTRFTRRALTTVIAVARVALRTGCGSRFNRLGRRCRLTLEPVDQFLPQ
jgi:hypothetical protein